MSVRYIPYQNRLAKLIRGAGGKSFEDAVGDADANLKGIEDASLSVLDQKIEEIRQLAAAPPAPQTRERLYAAANEIVGLGGVFGLPDLSQAAYSLCELIDQSAAGGPGVEAVRVHIDALRLLRLGEAAPPAERRQVLEGLRDVVRRSGRLSA